MRTSPFVVAALLLCFGLAEAQPPAFFAPPEPTGSVTVRLYPMENVTTSVPRLVTFGVPFTRGSLSNVSTVRVLKGGAEIPAFVEALTPWRHITNAALNGASVRIARIQIVVGLTARYPGFEEVVVEWGSTNRALNVATFQNPRSGWHAVTSGSYVAADGVSEPDVYAVLPASHLTKGAVRPMRMAPMAATVTEARDDPAAVDAIESWPGYSEMDHASKNNLFTVVNEDPGAPNEVNYKTSEEPWLYDRAATMFVVYLRSGFLKPLREAVRNAEFHRKTVWPAGTTPASAVGCSRLKNPDPAGYIGGTGAMYSYNESLAFQHWLTGDVDAREAVAWVVNCHETVDDNEPTRWDPSLPGWTERHTAFRLQVNLVAYEVLGDVEYRDRVVAQSGDFIWHQNGADGQVPTTRIDGGLWHTMLQHEGADAPLMMASPWMAVLTLDAMVRTYAFTEDPLIARFIRRMGTFLSAASKRVPSTEYEIESPTIREVDYITFINGTTFDGDGTTPEHALEVAAALAWSDYFGRLLGEPHPTAAAVAADLYQTYDIGVNYWIRPGAPPAFRVNPPRKWAWEHRVSGSLSFVFPVSTLDAPIGLTLVSSVGNTVTISWTVSPASIVPTGYFLEGGISPGQVLASMPTGSTASSFTFTAPTGRFYIRVHAVAGATRSAASNEIQIAVNVPVPPSAPTNLRGLANGSTLALAWVNATAGAGLRLNVTGSIQTTMSLSPSENFTYVGVPAGTYSFSVQSENAAGVSSASNAVTLTFPGSCSGAPEPPTNFTVTKSGSTITATWSPSATGPLTTSYALAVTGAFTGNFPTSGRSLSGAAGPGQYTLRVTATNPCGTSASTPPQTVTLP